jgi:hypothetical protein
MLANRLAVQPGGYTAAYVGLTGGTSAARPAFASFQLQRDWIYSGTLQSASLSLSAASGKHLTTSISLAHNDVELGTGALHFELASARVGLALSTRTFINALVQANSLSREAAGQIRLMHTYRPGSDLFVVIGQENGSPDAPWEFQRRRLRLKLTYLARL